MFFSHRKINIYYNYKMPLPTGPTGPTGPIGNAGTISAAKLTLGTLNVGPTGNEVASLTANLVQTAILNTMQINTDALTVPGFVFDLSGNFELDGHLVADHAHLNHLNVPVMSGTYTENASGMEVFTPVEVLGDLVVDGNLDADHAKFNHLNVPVMSGTYTENASGVEVFTPVEVLGNLKVGREVLKPYVNDIHAFDVTYDETDPENPYFKQTAVEKKHSKPGVRNLNGNRMDEHAYDGSFWTIAGTNIIQEQTLMLARRFDIASCAPFKKTLFSPDRYYQGMDFFHPVCDTNYVYGMFRDSGLGENSKLWVEDYLNGQTNPSYGGVSESNYEILGLGWIFKTTADGSPVSVLVKFHRETGELLLEKSMIDILKKKFPNNPEYVTHFWLWNGDYRAASRGPLYLKDEYLYFPTCVTPRGFYHKVKITDFTLAYTCDISKELTENEDLGIVNPVFCYTPITKGRWKSGDMGVINDPTDSDYNIVFVTSAPNHHNYTALDIGFTHVYKWFVPGEMFVFREKKSTPNADPLRLFYWQTSAPQIPVGTKIGAIRNTYHAFADGKDYYKMIGSIEQGIKFVDEATLEASNTPPNSGLWADAGYQRIVASTFKNESTFDLYTGLGVQYLERIPPFPSNGQYSPPIWPTVSGRRPVTDTGAATTITKFMQVQEFKPPGAPDYGQLTHQTVVPDASGWLYSYQTDQSGNWRATSRFYVQDNYASDLSGSPIGLDYVYRRQRPGTLPLLVPGDDLPLFDKPENALLDNTFTWPSSCIIYVWKYQRPCRELYNLPVGHVDYDNWVTIAITTKNAPGFGGYYTGGYVNFENNVILDSSGLQQDYTLYPDNPAAYGQQSFPVDEREDPGLGKNLLVPGWSLLDLTGAGIFTVGQKGVRGLMDLAKPFSNPLIKTIKTNGGSTWNNYAVKNNEVGSFHYAGGSLYTGWAYDEATGLLVTCSANGSTTAYDDWWYQLLYARDQITTVYKFPIYNSIYAKDKKLYNGRYQLAPITTLGNDSGAQLPFFWNQQSTAQRDSWFMLHFNLQPNNNINATLDSSNSSMSQYFYDSVYLRKTGLSVTDGPLEIYDIESGSTLTPVDNVTYTGYYDYKVGGVMYYECNELDDNDFMTWVSRHGDTSGTVYTGNCYSYDQSPTTKKLITDVMDIRYTGPENSFRVDPAQSSDRSRRYVSCSSIGFDLPTIIADVVDGSGVLVDLSSNLLRTPTWAVRMHGKDDTEDHATDAWFVVDPLVGYATDSITAYYAEAGINDDLAQPIILMNYMDTGMNILIQSSKCQTMVLDLDRLSATSGYKPPAWVSDVNNANCVRQDAVIFTTHAPSVNASHNWQGFAVDDPILESELLQHVGSGFYIRYLLQGNNDNIYSYLDSAGKGHYEYMKLANNTPLLVQNTSVIAYDFVTLLSYGTDEERKMNERFPGKWRCPYGTIEPHGSSNESSALCIVGDYVVATPKYGYGLYFIHTRTGILVRTLPLNKGSPACGVLTVDGVIYHFPQQGRISSVGGVVSHMLMLTPDGM